MDQVVYNNDTRYPGPSTHPPPEYIKGIPTRADLDAFPRMFTWGELKSIIKTGELERLMRNKAMQARYDEWMVGIKVQYGSTENYLTRARLPWSSSPSQPSNSTAPTGTYDLTHSPTLPSTSTTLPVDLVPSTNPNLSSDIPIQSSAEIDASSNVATPGGRGAPSGSATPSSAGFVSLASLKLVNGKLNKTRLNRGGSVGSGGSTPGTRKQGGEEGSSGGSNGGSPDVKPENGTTAGESLGRQFDGMSLDEPRGVHVGGSRDGSNGENTTEDGAEEDRGEGEVEGENGEGGEDEQAVYLRWDEKNGLDGEKYAVLPNDWPYNVPYGVRHYCVWSRVPIAHPELVDYDPEAWGRIESEGLGGFTGITPLREFHIPSPTSSTPRSASSPTSPTGASTHQTDTTSTSNATPDVEAADAPQEILFTEEMIKRTKLIGRLKEKDWYAADVAYAGGEMRQWAGVKYESKGGREVGRMVEGLWDPKGWECLWFVNPPRLQSVPGFSHFHVFARRKTPEEIDASEGA